MRALAQLCLALLIAGGYNMAVAQVSIPATASVQLNGGTLDLGGGDLLISGTTSLGAGTLIDAASVSILSGGLLDAGSGTVSLYGNWLNYGNFAAGSSSVNFIDGPRAAATLAGTTSFHSVSFTSATGKNYIFPVGTAQAITTSLTILGTAATGIQFRSATPGQVAFISLAPAGAQNIDYVGVSDVYATGQALAPTKTNDGGTGNSFGWFGAPLPGPMAAPALTSIGLLLLALILTTAARYLRRTSL